MKLINFFLANILRFKQKLEWSIKKTPKDLKGLSQINYNTMQPFEKVDSKTEKYIEPMFSSSLHLKNFPHFIPEENDLPRLQRAFNYAIENNIGLLTLESSKTYRINNKINIVNANKLLILGNNAQINFESTVTSVNGGVKAISILDSKNIILDGLHIKFITQEEYSGISVEASNTITIRNCSILNARWAGISIWDKIDNTSFLINIECNKIEYCRFGIVSNGEFVFIRNNNYISNHWKETEEANIKNFIWSEPSLYYDGIIIKGENWIITDNVIVDNGQSGIYTGGAKKGIIRGNIIKNNMNQGIDLGPVGPKPQESYISYIKIEGNIIENNVMGNIQLNNVDNCIINNNICIITDKYLDTSNIILNGSSNYNIIQNNRTSSILNNPSVFINKDFNPSPSTNNIVENNIINASKPYHIDASTNILVSSQMEGRKSFYSDVEFLGNIKSVLTIDRSNEQGFSGRNLINLIGSSDNNFIQVSSNKPVRLLKKDGNNQGFFCGELSATSLTMTGAAFFSDNASIRLPRVSQPIEGYMWYDLQTKTIKYNAGGGIIKTIKTF
ncbi:right-handed parallel beta-helix repeat-containing protein [Priestia megaterium]|uniref:right-handed parallel beta-helix repeat-containing protein n=1 Tax=Priestia megaterium TaxID=1404 RepID=UPI001890A6CD|nr:right-handed parallel beta-helix repeat-containing protein [Priestia megaterium]